MSVYNKNYAAKNFFLIMLLLYQNGVKTKITEAPGEKYDFTYRMTFRSIKQKAI